MKKNYKTKTNPVRNKTLTGFTLMEVIVGLIIISLIFGGIVATFVGVKRYVSRATRRVVSTNLDRQFLNSLYRDVRADTWDAGALSPGTHNAANVVIDNFAYGTAGTPNSYDVQAVAGRDYRQVTVTVSYPTN